MMTVNQRRHIKQGWMIIISMLAILILPPPPNSIISRTLVLGYGISLLVAIVLWLLKVRELTKEMGN